MILASSRRASRCSRHLFSRTTTGKGAGSAIGRRGMIADIHFMFEYSFVTRLISLLARAQVARTGAKHDANRRQSRRRRGAVRSGQPPALGRLAGPRPLYANRPRPRLHGVQNRDLALLPSAVAPHPQIELVLGSQSSSSSSSKSRGSINMSVPGTRCREGTGPLPAQ